MDNVLRNGLLSVALALCAAIPLHAHGDDSQRSDPSIAGTWVARVTTATSSFLSMTTFMPGGQVIEENNNTAIRSVAQGEWERAGGRQFIRTMYVLNFTAPRTFTGMTKVTNYIQLNHAGDEYDSTADTETYDASGNLVSVGHNTSHARRCTADTTVPHCLGIGP
jgi:hypothetical protein